MATAGTTYIELRAKIDQFNRELEAAGVAASKSATGMEKSFTSKFKTIGDRAGAVAGHTKFLSAGIAAGFLGASKAASDLSETVSFTEVTFKGAADRMLAWSEQSLESMGLAKQSALAAANEFGGLFQVTGSTAREAAGLSQKMTQLAVDMASAKNVNLEEAIAALGSGLRGEAEPMRRFNVLLSEQAIESYAVKNGIVAQNAEMSEAEKVQARLGLIMQQTTDIQGDYGRTADSTANKQRRATEAAKEAAAELGENLAPITAKVADLAGDVASAFTKMPDAAQTGVVAIGGVLFAISPVAKGIEGLSKLWVIYRTRQAAAAAASMTQIVPALGATNAAATGAAGGVGLLSKALRALPWVAAAAGAKAVADEMMDLTEHIVDQEKPWRDQISSMHAVKRAGIGIFDEPQKEARKTVGVLNRVVQATNAVVEAMSVNVGAGFLQGSPTAAGVFGGTGTPTNWAIDAMGAVPGFQMITSSYRPNDTDSFHSTPPPYNAVDIGGSNLGAVFGYLASRYSKNARELIFGNTIIEKGRVGYYPPNDHWDHVHLADMGAIIKGPAWIRQGNITEAHIPLTGPGAKSLGPTIHIHGDVYGYQDFENKVVAAMDNAVGMRSSI